MNDKKLDDLIRKGLDERTPDLEALVSLRIAAKHFSESKAGAAQDAERLSKLEQERDQARAEATKHKAEAERLRLILGKMLALKDAEQKLEKNKADVEREAKETLGQKAAPKAPQHQNPFYTETWFDNFGGFRTDKF
jgi:hypothetical protein